MSTIESILPGIPEFHEIPADIKIGIVSDPLVLKNWNSLTPIARNEWICWATMPKQKHTKEEHTQRLLSDISAGKKRPCCWPGCPHRNKAAEKYFTKR